MITREQIEQLQQDAGQAGDERQVELCRLALSGNAEALARCESVIGYAQGRSDDEPGWRHVCRACGAEVSAYGWCQAHPSAIVDTVRA